MFFNAGPTMTIDHSYWLLVTGYLEPQDTAPSQALKAG